ncbi:MAG: hypothetical protein ACJ74W_10270 [Pyrinomonadaceae bacterium]
MLDLEELIDLIEELRLAGYNVGAQQYSAAQDLLLALATRGRLPAEPHGLATWLAPILCSGPKEQENFYRHFTDWLARRPHLTTRGPQPAQPETTEHATAQSAPPTFMRRLQAVTARLRQRPKALMAGVVALILLLTSAVLLRSMSQTLPDISAPEQPLNGHVLGAQGEAVEGARVDFAGQTASSGARGEFSLTYKPEQATAQLAVSHPDYEANSVAYDQAAALLNHTAPRLIQLRQRTAAPPPVADAVFTPTPLPTPTPTPPPTVYEKYYSWLRAAAVGLPLLIFLAWWLARWRRRRMLLQKLPSARQPLLERIVVRGAAERLYQGQTFRRTVQELRRHRQRGARELDAQVTVQATARKGGLFTPFYGSRKTLPEYLVLLDRASLRDQQARLEEELIKRLTEENVFIDLYYFQGEPRLCRKQEQGAPYLTLPDLAALHPEHHLLIFSDGASFINQFTGEPERWLEQFGPWPRRALLTPESPADWRYREWLLTELNFIVLPADRTGLAALGETINTGAPPKLDGRDGASPYPELLRERPRRWLERHAPRPAVAARLNEELQRFLGAEGYYWLCACAVYPALHWNLTLYFGQRLLANRDEIETQLLALVRLPWFRYGQMPDWLRLRLISALTQQQEQAVRRALEELLTSALENPAAGLPLDIAPPTAASEPHGLRKLLHALTGRLRRWRQQRNLRTLLRNEPPPSPLRDYVFLSFMSRRTHRLSVRVPETLRRLLYPQGQPILGLRPASAFALATTLSLIGLLALPKPQPKPPCNSASVQPCPSPTPTPEPSLTGQPLEPTPANTNQPPPVGPSPLGAPILSVPGGSGTIGVDVDADYARLVLEQIKVARDPRTGEIKTQIFQSSSINGASRGKFITFNNVPAGFQYQVRAWRGLISGGDWVVVFTNGLLGKGQVVRLRLNFDSVRPAQTATPALTPSPTPTDEKPVAGPDNSTIDYFPANAVGGPEAVRVFKSRTCPIASIDLYTPAQSVTTGGSATIHLRKGGEQELKGREKFAFTATCAEIMNAAGLPAATPTPTPSVLPTLPAAPGGELSGGTSVDRYAAKIITGISGSNTSNGSKVTIVANVSLNDYSAYRSGDRFYVVLPNARAKDLGSARGRGFNDAQVSMRGPDVILSFKLQPGTSARVNQRGNQLFILFILSGTQNTNN